MIITRMKSADLARSAWACPAKNGLAAFDDDAVVVARRPLISARLRHWASLLFALLFRPGADDDATVYRD